MRRLLAVAELLVENETNRTILFVADVARIHMGFADVRTAVGALARSSFAAWVSLAAPCVEKFDNSATQRKQLAF